MLLVGSSSLGTRIVAGKQACHGSYRHCSALSIQAKASCGFLGKCMHKPVKTGWSLLVVRLAMYTGAAEGEFPRMWHYSDYSGQRPGFTSGR